MRNSLFDSNLEMKPVPNPLYMLHLLTREELFWLTCIVAMTSYGAFWMSYGTILIPGSGVAAAFGGDEKEFGNALGVFFVVWFMFTTMLMCVYVLIFTVYTKIITLLFNQPGRSTQKSRFHDPVQRTGDNIHRISCGWIFREIKVSQLEYAPIQCPLNHFSINSVIKGGGIIGIITALVAYYIAISELLGSDDKAYVKLPLGVW